MRHGSDEARVWARHLHFGDVRAKSILMAICNYVNEHGAADPSIPTLAEDTDQSDDSVRRRLKDLEDFGVLVRLHRWVDPAGKINTDGKGRRTSDELRLFLHVERAILQIRIDEARARGKTEPDDGTEFDPSQQRGSDPSQEQGATENLTLASSEGQTLAASEGLDSSLKEDNPPTPLTGGRLGGDSERDQRWVAFEAAFTADGAPIQKPSLARQVLDALTPGECAAAIPAASGYVVYRRSERKPTTKLAAHTFLRERGSWDRFAAFAPSSGGSGPAPVVGVKPLSRAWWWCFFRYVDLHGIDLRETLSRPATWLRMQVTKSLKYQTPWPVEASKIAEVEEAAKALVNRPKDGDHARLWRHHLQSQFNVWLPTPDTAEFVFLPSTGPPNIGKPNSENHQLQQEGVG